MRRSVLGVVAGVAVVAVAAVTVAVVRATGDDPAAPACAPAARPAVSSPPVPTASSAPAAGVTVAEQGYSPVPDRGPYVTVGAVLRNTTDQVAWRTRVFIDATGDSGPSLVFAPRPSAQILEVPTILPGATASVGFVLAVKSEDVPKVTKVSLTPVVTAWLPAGDANDGLAPIATKVESVTPAGRPDQVTFTVTTANCVDLVMRGVGVVWRDKTGKIVGGGLGIGYDPRMCQAGGAGPGDAPVARLYENMVPASADVTKTEVNPYCDLARADPGTAGQTFNN